MRDRYERQCFRVRADVFASAHGRPDGMPGRIIGARAKGLPGRGWGISQGWKSRVWDMKAAKGRENSISDLRFQIGNQMMRDLGVSEMNAVYKLPTGEVDRTEEADTPASQLHVEQASG